MAGSTTAADVDTPLRELARASAVFSSVRADQRSRRPADGVAVAVGVGITALAAAEAEQPSGLVSGLEQVVDALPAWMATALGAAYAAAGVWVLVVLVGAAIARRPSLVRDVVVAIALTLVAGAVLARMVEGEWPAVGRMLWDRGEPAVPTFRVAAAAAAVVTAAPHLIRPLRRLGYVLALLAPPAALALDLANGVGVATAAGLGLAAGGATNLVFGSPGGIPPLGRVADALAAMGVPVTHLQLSDDRVRGAVVVDATAADGRALRVKVYGRDAADTQLFTMVWRSLWYRHSASTLTLNRLQQAEHEALVMVVGGQAGARVPTLAAAGISGRTDAVLAVSDAGRAYTTASELGPDDLRDLWRQLDLLAARRVAHGNLDVEHLGATADGPVIRDWDGATLTGTDEQLQADRAALVLLSALAVGPALAVEVAQSSLGTERLASVVPYLQTAALPPALRRDARAADLDVDDVRELAADVAGVEKPATVKLRRVTVGSVALVVVTLFAASFLLSSLASIGFDTLLDTFQRASLGWLVVALAFSLTPRVAAAFSTIGSAATLRLPLGPTVLLQLSLSYINLAVPSTAARVAVSVRYFQKFGASAPAALTFGAIDSFTQFLVQVSLLLITIGLGLSSLEFDLEAPQVDTAAILRILGFVAVALVIAALVALTRPKVRGMIRTAVHEVRTALGMLRSSRQLLMLVGGNAAAETLFSITLGLCALAYGHHLGLANLIVINIGVAMFSGLMPVPGGIGVTEGALTVGLIAAGLPEADAFATALSFRMVTFYLPPIWGFAAFRRLTRNGYL